MTASSIADTWERGNPYERYVGRWSRQVAPAFLAWLGAGPGLRWLDVGCGTGALSAAIVAHARPASVCGVDPSAAFLETARSNLGPEVALHPAGAGSLPLDDASVDVSISGLVLNFVPDLPGALAEMRRVTAPGGTIAGYVWDYADGMELIRCFWDAAVELDPAAATLHEGARFPLCSPSALAAAFRTAGMDDVATTSIDIPTRFDSFADYWTPFLGGQGPAPAYAMSLDEARRRLLADRLAQRLPLQADGALALTARAWAVRGRRRPD
jgi:SAM-dependent methyltransferase